MSATPIEVGPRHRRRTGSIRQADRAVVVRTLSISVACMACSLYSVLVRQTFFGLLPTVIGGTH